MGGPLVMRLAANRKAARLLPVDSEHSAVFQALQCGPAVRGEAGHPDRQRRPVSRAFRSSNWPR